MTSEIAFDESTLAWQKMKGLIPAIVQDAKNLHILMLGYMTREALLKTLKEGRVTFYSRSKQKLWTKGETSGNYLQVCDISTDCDNDTLLITANAVGPTCHLGKASCFANKKPVVSDIISKLEQTIAKRQIEKPKGSYVASLFEAGLPRMAQKVGEEALEVAIAAVVESKQKIAEEAADLLFHLLVLLRAKELSFEDVADVLQQRDNSK